MSGLTLQGKGKKRNNWPIRKEDESWPVNKPEKRKEEVPGGLRNLKKGKRY